jgi:hypothetical protein
MGLETMIHANMIYSTLKSKQRDQFHPCITKPLAYSRHSLCGEYVDVGSRDMDGGAAIHDTKIIVQFVMSVRVCFRTFDSCVWM